MPREADSLPENMIRTTLTSNEERFIESQGVLRLGTTGADCNPHVVPLCYAYRNGVFYMHLKNGDAYKRMKNIEATGKATVLVDYYNPGWKLGKGGNIGILLECLPQTLPERDEENAKARKLLVEKYDQYRGTAIETGCPVLKVAVRRVVSSWGCDSH